MKTLFSVIVSFVLFAGSLFAQQLPGTWHNSTYQITITMMTDGSFLTRAGQNLISGT